MDWRKEIGRRAGAGGWKEDLPLDELPEPIELDCSKLELPIHPMFAVRLRVFIDWHSSRGRSVRLIPPEQPQARDVFEAMNIRGGTAGQEDDAVVPVSKISEFTEVEEVANRTQRILEYDLPDVSALGQATFMAVSELCGNAIEHGSNFLGGYVAVRRVQEPRRQVSIAIADLGIGIPEHLRQRYPEWGDDGWAIAHAMDEHVTGTGDQHRGIGFSAVFEAALTRSLHGAQLNILSANGFCRVHLVQEERKVEVFPIPRFRRGTWITYDLVSV
jgi:anti-sigma regulatory factor (Ser/Thr protein kinase)